jgi:hypothetical protein
MFRCWGGDGETGGLGSAAMNGKARRGDAMKEERRGRDGIERRRIRAGEEWIEDLHLRRAGGVG